MSVNSVTIDQAWRDYVNQWSAQVWPWFEPLARSRCHVARLVVAPDSNHQQIPTGGKLTYNFQLIPGSLLWGIWPFVSAFDNTVQLTDVALDHKIFQEPLDQALLWAPGATFSHWPSVTLLPAPHPVVGDGLFTLEVWGNAGDSFAMVLGVAEVTECPVR